MRTRSTLIRAACLAATGAIMTTTGCQSGDNNAEPTTATPAPETNTLRTVLEARQAEFAQKADPAMQTEFAAGIDAVRDADVVAGARTVGDLAPGFTLPDANGAPVRLASLLEDGPVVIVWYRGGWCPYCNLTLRAYQERLDEIRSHGATLVAISPELPDNALSTQEKQELEYVVLTDASNAVAKDYGVVFDLTPDVHTTYNKLFDFDTWNGQSSGELPLAATYVIDRGGTIRYAFLDADYRARAEPSDVIAALEGI